jgi:predicted acyltransferase
VLGVLQRISICYAAAAGIYLITSWRTQVACVIGLLTTYWMLMFLVPVPGYGAGHLDVERNLAHYVDQMVLGAHNYAHTKTWDPEGIVSTIPALATALFGVLCGQMLRAKRALSQRVLWMIITGGVLIAAGLICNQWLPINKKLWTSSFALFMAGLDFTLLGGFMWLIDGLGVRRWARPLEILGMNAIAVYMLSEMIDPIWSLLGWREPIYHAVASLFSSPYNASLAYAVLYTLLMYAIAWVMYRRGWFLKV